MAPPSDEFLMLIVSSPSGAGKTTLCRRLRSEIDTLRFSVSHTTRAARGAEVDGHDYHFVDVGTFKRMAAEGAFAEWARVHDNFYGTSRAEIDRARAAASGLIFDIDHQGARQLKAAYPGAVGVFILPPSLTELERRLRGRGTETEERAARRLANARGEIEHYGIFDYVVVNDDLDRAYADLKSIVLAERCRRSRHASLCERILAEGKLTP
jgi:guanylate kinase